MKEKIKRKLRRVKKEVFLLKSFFYPIPTPEKWVFIVGCSNSGTSLLHQLLSIHPDVGSLPHEGQFFTNQLPIAQDYGLPRLWTKREDIFRIDQHASVNINVTKLKKHWALSYNDINRPILIEKTTTNAARIKWLNKNFDNAYFIGIVRNGYVVAEGIERKAGHDIETAAKHWLRVNQILFEDLKQVERSITLSYEDLTGNTKNELRKIYDFLGIENSNNLIDPNRAFKINEVTSKISNMNDKSFKRLSGEKIKKINRAAGQFIKDLGYNLLEG